MSPWSWALTAAGAAVLLAGLVVTARARRPVEVEEARREGEPVPPPRFFVERLFDRLALTTPTIAVIGLGMLALGYHLLAWGLPAGYLALRVPAENWWMLAGGIAALVALSLLVDRGQTP